MNRRPAAECDLVACNRQCGQDVAACPPQRKRSGALLIRSQPYHDYLRRAAYELLSREGGYLSGRGLLRSNGGHGGRVQVEGIAGTREGDVPRKRYMVSAQGLIKLSVRCFHFPCEPVGLRIVPNLQCRPRRFKRKQGEQDFRNAPALLPTMRLSRLEGWSRLPRQPNTYAPNLPSPSGNAELKLLCRWRRCSVYLRPPRFNPLPENSSSE